MITAGDRVSFRPSYQNARASAKVVSVDTRGWLTVAPDKQFSTALFHTAYEYSSGWISINIDLHLVEKIS